VLGALLQADGGVVRPEHLSIDTAAQAMPLGTWEESMADYKRHLITETLRRTGGNRAAAARELAISRQTLLYHIRTLGLKDKV
jgi:transcriptional regulator with PAS, ATPase and Fis domain